MVTGGKKKTGHASHRHVRYFFFFLFTDFKLQVWGYKHKSITTFLIKPSPWKNVVCTDFFMAICTIAKYIRDNRWLILRSRLGWHTSSLALARFSKWKSQVTDLISIIGGNAALLLIALAFFWSSNRLLRLIEMSRPRWRFSWYFYDEKWERSVIEWIIHKGFLILILYLFSI